MGGNVTATIVWMLIVISNAIKVDITEEWIPGFGWNLTCFWDIPSNDSLQSLKFFSDGKPIVTYRPEKHGPVIRDGYETSEMRMTIHCEVTEPRYQKGQCEVQIVPFQPPEHNFAVRCEVSGERPTFKLVEQEHLVKILGTPSNATIISKIQQEESKIHVSLNCSSFGLLAPNLVWTMDDDKHAQADFTGRAWNATSKLWHVWSFLSYTPGDPVTTVTCTPVASIDGESVKGVPAEFNSTERCLSTTFLISAAVLASQLLR